VILHTCPNDESESTVASTPSTSTTDSTDEEKSDNSPARSSSQRSGSRQPASGNRSELVGDMGRTAIADSVVAKIAGLACREISGVHDMGTGASRTFGAIKGMVNVGNDRPSPTQGVGVEVGARQAAVDLDIVVEYGASIVDVAESIRNNVIAKVEGMTGLEVTEVNVSVDDVYLGEPEQDDDDSDPRVQ